ncbi:sensor histidine kinase [Flavobacterium silvaticum]|uniref:histidine kinase n=1 Tax=Flavobacterium silvaticum TaxID=1852020 RepID=A0A972FWV5_9FLAO|nr:HAMP domain-containing sensor histidine kinase [Flavobacterium silvaticum]NMH29120.1 HAMP domain-containing histidine kinase [Flavobacterium silvaticum]
MNKLFFRVLVGLMSLSLIGIILVQVYWFNTSFKNNDEQFRFHVKQVMSNVAEQLEKKEYNAFVGQAKHVYDSTGKMPGNKDFLETYYFQRDRRTNETIIYSNNIFAEDYKITPSFFDKLPDSVKLQSFSGKRTTEIYNGRKVDDGSVRRQINPDIKIEKSGPLDEFNELQFVQMYKDLSKLQPIEQRIPADSLNHLLKRELEQFGVKTPFEFGVYGNGLATKVKSENFVFDKKDTYSIPIFSDEDGNYKYQLLASFPQKKKFLFSELIGITILSIVFTLIIIIAYSSALNQLIKQRQISEIKTDFINNMTHEFKTPIATINLALDAIKNPKVIENQEMVKRYLQMIRDENKRMHAQVENVLRISKLEKKELDIAKESTDLNEIIEEAIEHVSLIVEDRQGSIDADLKAVRSTVLLNDVHFTNVIVNILENAVKYTPGIPEILVTTENVKDFVIVKVKDNGIGMSKATQKKIFEKFYREHTGDIHNVKGHGLGLAYVKRIVDDHNGQIFVESEKGKGSTFIIKLPLIN